MPIRAFLGALAALFLLSFAGTLTAQTTEGASPPDGRVQEQIEQIVTILEDDAVRAALLDRLRETGAPAEPEEPQPEPNVAQQLAAAMATFFRDAASEVGSIQREMTRILSLGTQLQPNGRDLGPQVLTVALTIATTIAAALAFGSVAAGIARRLAPAPDAGLVKRVQLTALAIGARLIAVALAWALGYGLAVFVFSQDNAPSQAQILYLNAFLVFGVLRVALRALANPDADREPVLSQLPATAQAVIFRNVRLVMGIVVQGFLFLIPLTQLWIGFAAVRPVRTLIATVAAIAALVAIRKIARAVDAAWNAEAARDRATGTAEDEDDTAAAMASGAQSAWRRVWPPLAIGYVLYAWFLAVTRPNIVADVVLTGTGYTVIAVLLFLAALRLMKRAPDVRAPMPKAVRTGLPKLPPRANQIATVVAYVVVLALVLTAVGLILTGWDWVDVAGWMASDAAQTVFWRIASAALVTLFAALLWAVTASWIDERLMDELTGRNVSARSRTLLALFRNAFTIVLVVLATMIALSQLGINIAPLLAGAGVIGLAVGFGAQKLVQDIITGTFIQLENAINEGDVVGVAGTTGGVEKVTIRSVRIRTLDGAVHIIPFSSVDTVTNLSRDFSFHVAEVGAAYKEKVSDVKEAMQEAFDRLKAEGEFTRDIIAPLEMHGVTALGDSAVVVRARIKTLPGKQWGLGRRYTELVKEVFDERGIEIPFPHRQLMLPEGFVEMMQDRLQGDPRDVTPQVEHKD